MMKSSAELAAVPEPIHRALAELLDAYPIG
jgi:hypothetical protein